LSTCPKEEKDSLKETVRQRGERENRKVKIWMRMTLKKGGKTMEIGNSLFLTAMASMPWCIHEGMFNTFQNILNNKMDGLNLKVSDTGLTGKSQPYIIGSTGVVAMQGTLLKRAYNMSSPSGDDRSLEDIQQNLRDFANDKAVDTILLDIESPGGSVPGVSETAALIREIKKDKPVLGVVGGLCCSAAYWIGSACTELYASETSQVGSIGVYQVHLDRTALNEKMGVKLTYVKAGKYKALGNPDSALDEEALAKMQESVNKLYSLFISGVAENRSVDSAMVEKEWADARVFFGTEAKNIGMIDDIVTIDEILG
jgi:signal peptide peptidase SppA